LDNRSLSYDVLVFDESSTWFPEYFSKSHHSESFECLKHISYDTVKYLLTSNEIPFVELGIDCLIQYPVEEKYILQDYFSSEDIMKKVMDDTFPIKNFGGSLVYSVQNTKGIDYQSLDWVRYINEKCPNLKIYFQQ